MDIEQSGREMQVDTVHQVQQIVKEVKNQIREGKLPAGTRLPSEYTLTKQFGVSRTVAHQVLQKLEQEYLVPAEELRLHGSFDRDMQARGHQPEVIFLEEPIVIAAAAEVAEHLYLSPGQLVLKRYRLQIADNMPYRIIESYYPAELFGELLTIDIGEQPLFHWLEQRYGLKAKRAEEKLKARLANDYESRYLDISPNALVMGLERTVWAHNGRVIEWAKITAAADRYTFTYKYEIELPQQ